MVKYKCSVCKKKTQFPEIMLWWTCSHCGAKHENVIFPPC